MSVVGSSRVPVLTLRGENCKSNSKVVGFPESFYAEARLRAGTIPVLREDEPAPPERLLQAIWHHQRIHRQQLQTMDGRALRVLHPGFWNRESGPDFRRALLQFDE